MYNLLKRLSQRFRMLKWVVTVKLHSDTGTGHSRNIVLFDPSIDSQNMGDTIIRQYCFEVLTQLFPSEKMEPVPTHTIPNNQQLSAIAHAQNKIVCGTNLITPHYEEYSNWKMPSTLSSYRGIITLGVGWGYYCNDISKISRFVYRTILSKQGLHSVRDSYTEHKFREMGISNVINTGCPTLWGLTPKICAAIPCEKAHSVITTLTDYARDEELDRFMIDILKNNYETVYVWLQGSGDEAYLNSLTDVSAVSIIPSKLEAYTRILDLGDVDYVGTRLHAGIHAMNRGVRSIILAVDNRAIEMGKDFCLPVIRRADLAEKLSGQINGKWHTHIKLPVDAITKWKKQFEE